MNDDIRAMLERAKEVGRGDGIVDDDRHTMPLCDRRNLRDIRHVTRRITDRLHEHGLGPVVDQCLEAFRATVIGKPCRNAKLRHGMRQQVVGAAIERRGSDDIVAGLGDRLDRRRDRCLAGCDCQRSNTAFQRRDPLLKHVGRRVHDPGVDIPRHLQIEQVRAMLRVVEGVCRRLVDRNCHRLSRGVRAISRVDRTRFEFPVFRH